MPKQQGNREGNTARQPGAADGVLFFASRSELRAWFAKHHAIVQKAWIGFHKKNSGFGGITYHEAVDEALCVGWIDGLKRSIDATRYAHRFTPRKSRSIWSAVNIRRAEALIDAGRMNPSGLRKFEARDAGRTDRYSYERSQAALPPDFEKRFRENGTAWAHFMTRPPSYRKTAIWWVVSAVRESTRQSRLTTLINDSAEGKKIAPLTRPSERKTED